MSVPRADMDAYVEHLRDYNQRLCAWLGMDPGQVYRLRENRTGGRDPLDPPGLRVTWHAAARQEPARGVVVETGVHGHADELVAFTGIVALDFEDLRALRAEVGERPEMPGLAEARAAFLRQDDRPV